MRCGDICAGDLRQRVTLYRKSRTPDGRGGFDETWSEYATVRARVDTPSASERFFAQGQEDAVTHRFILRYRTDIESTDILVWRGEVYTIRRPIDIEGKRRWLQLDASISARVAVDELDVAS